MNKTTYFEALKWASLFIQKHGGDENAPEILMMDMLNWSRSELMMHYRQELEAGFEDTFKKAIQRVVDGEPVQYVSRQASFFGRAFYVDQRVLIPRVETEELIELILQRMDAQSKLNVLDIGTGSGDIAITLKLERPLWNVTAVDISAAALEVAKINAKNLGAEIDFKQGSIFDPVQDQQFDLIISNPPYIAEDEKSVMDASVIKYEPHQALFATDNGLFWYKQIADQMALFLVPKGQLACEIGYRQGSVLKQYFMDKVDVDQVEVIKDLSQHDRMLWVKKK